MLLQCNQKQDRAGKQTKKSPQNQRNPHNPKENHNTFHVSKHIRGLNFAWTLVSSPPILSLKAPVRLQLNCVTALEASRINRKWMNAV